MKTIHGLLVLAVFFTSAIGAQAATPSSMEGRIVDASGAPIAEVNIRAEQVEPLKGYEIVTAKSGSDGKFTLKGLYPGVDYTIYFQAEGWSTELREFLMKSAPGGETAIIPGDVLLRFKKLKEGVLYDTKTRLEWLPGPRVDFPYDEACAFIKFNETAGGGWSMPTREQLLGLHEQRYRMLDFDAAFNLGPPPVFIWAEPKDAKSAYYVQPKIFNFEIGAKGWHWAPHNMGRMHRAFGVRQAKSVPAPAKQASDQ